MNFSFIHPFKLNLKLNSVKEPEVYMHQPPHSTSEGSEFLDEGLRMEDYLPTATYTEVSVSSGNPDNLF
jgi:hypothetical protein